MRPLSIAACLLLLTAATPALAGAAEDAALAPVHQFIDRTNAGDTKGAAAAYTANPTILDEFAPYHWQGPHAFAEWSAGFEAEAKAGGLTDAVITTLKPTRVSITGDHAYAVIPTLYDYKLKGKDVREHGTFSFALQKTARGWRIAGWAWAWVGDTQAP